jgi:hypothetical protein
VQKITTVADLNRAIVLLEIQQNDEWTIIKDDIHATCENLKPINFIKNTVRNLMALPDHKEELIDTAIGLVVGVISKWTVIGTTHNPFKQLLGTLFQIGMTNLASKNTDGIKSVALSFLHGLFNRNHTSVEKQ